MTSSPDDTDHGRVNTDASITSLEEDRLERGEFSCRVADRIGMAGTGPSVTFGLSGAWGAGKTSVLNMIRSALANREGWVVVEFTPWATTDLDALTGEFYEVIASAIPQEKEAGKKARKLLMSAAPVTKSVLKAVSKGVIERYVGDGTLQEVADAFASNTLDTLASYEPTPDPFQQQFKAMSEAISEAESQVLVIVDDLDRLHSDELLAVMKAVRLLGRFDGVHYMLSYDRRTVLDLIGASDLAGSDPDRARAYLEKIVQYPFELPPLQPAHSLREISEQLTVIAERYSCDLSGTDPSSGREWRVIDELLNLLPSIDGNTTLRAIYRWCSQIDVLMTLVGPGHLDFLDAALVTYLRLHFEQIYDRLPRWRSELVGEPSMSSTSMATQQERADEWTKRICAEADRITELELDEAYQILAYLFPRVPYKSFLRPHPPTSNLQVHHDEFFDRYFLFTLPVGDISDVTVKEEVSSLLDDGALPEVSELRTFIDAGGADRQLALRKLSRELGRGIADTSPENALSVLEVLWPALQNEHGDLSFLSSSQDIAGTLMQQIVDASADVNCLREAVNRLSRSCGLRGVTQVLSLFRRGSDNYPDPIAAATTDVRDEVLQVCMDDLKASERLQAGGLLTFIHFLSTDMYVELRDRINREGLSQLDVAARLVARDGGAHPNSMGFYSEQFEEIYTREQWDLAQFGERPSETDLPAREDDSLEARRTRGRFAMHEIVLGMTSSKPD